MPGEHRVTVSATEIPQFRRLAAFVTEVSVHADETADDELREIVRTCRIDLLQMMAGAEQVYPRRRTDGWPLCPACGDDELWSAEIPATVETIVSCLGCGWRPRTP
jgi:predicted RNA-binding Zn-ribbon protein involved in translation (DUF1610 family)